MSRTEPWQKAEIPGPKRSLVITKPEVVVSMIKKAKRPIMIVGHEITENEDETTIIKYLIQLSKARKIPLVATANSVKKFLENRFKAAVSMPVVDIANRLQDSSWTGLDGKGQYDLVLSLGLPYYMQWLIFSALKNFSLGTKTISLGRFYQPNATWSFPNMSFKDWIESLEIIISKLEEKEK
ncbi:MAG: CO dehydrogenase/acetyl-CoA synthase complex subunit epsilon [Candidatus Hodarchaeota archaeon]